MEKFILNYDAPCTYYIIEYVQDKRHTCNSSGTVFVKERLIPWSSKHNTKSCDVGYLSHLLNYNPRAFYGNELYSPDWGISIRVMSKQFLSKNDSTYHYLKHSWLNNI